MSILAVLLFFVFVVFGIMGIVSLIRRQSTVKRNFLVSLVSFAVMIVIFATLGSQDTEESATKGLSSANNSSNNEINSVNNIPAAANATADQDAQAAADAEKAAEEAAKQKADAEAKAQAEADAELQAKQKAALAQMTAIVDEVEGITWYQDKSAPEYINENGIYAYFGVGNDGAVSGLHLKIQYAAKTWLFIKGYTFNIDGEKYEIDPGLLGVQRDMSTDFNSPGVWEYYDFTLSSSQMDMLQLLAGSEKTIMRLGGDQKVVDQTLSANQKAALQRVLDAYIATGGEV
ncbi:hypothetical protein [Paenibacillus sp. MMS20-IR301]|uniref:hypothetical protein n=1 Tax=Paenibacillus sp. MMS20-IR301 TaxID=2895946 RepID=UPI0028F0BAB1|nr:hypothetical protein [Paenibacillus sp. MMS20-IR301]WNS40862.1 hypothetical protein LOS79_17570 [Paenibacillus sp. MMS20-IR301]